MASLDEAFSGRRMDNNEPIVQLELYQSTDEIVNDIISFVEPIDELPSENELQEAVLNRQVQRTSITPSQQLASMRNQSPSRTRRRIYPNTRVTQEEALDRHICPELRQNLHNNTLILPHELRQQNVMDRIFEIHNSTISGVDRPIAIVPMPEAGRQNQVAYPLERNGFGGVGEINVTQGGNTRIERIVNDRISLGVRRLNTSDNEPPNQNLILPRRENLTIVAYHEDEYPVQSEPPNPNLKEKKSNKILEAAEKRRSEPKKEGFFTKLFKKGKNSEVTPEPKDPDLKKLLAKLKKDHAMVSVKLNKLEISLEQNKALLEKSTTKFKDLIDITEDQELIDILTKKMESNPLIEQNENIKKEIDELAKEYTVLTENCDSLAEVCPKNLCGVCFNSEVESFNECGHAFCNDCISKIKKCDRCNDDIRNTKKIFYN